jgi:hypothetical protein
VWRSSVRRLHRVHVDDAKGYCLLRNIGELVAYLLNNKIEPRYANVFEDVANVDSVRRNIFLMFCEKIIFYDYLQNCSRI